VDRVEVVHEHHAWPVAGAAEATPHVGPAGSEVERADIIGAGSPELLRDPVRKWPLVPGDARDRDRALQQGDDIVLADRVEDPAPDRLIDGHRRGRSANAMSATAGLDLTVAAASRQSERILAGPRPPPSTSIAGRMVVLCRSCPSPYQPVTTT
jgi:hypothetical protein